MHIVSVYYVNITKYMIENRQEKNMQIFKS